MKKITGSSLYFSVITDDALVQNYSLDATLESPAQNLLYASSSIYLIHQADARVIDDILQAERAGDNLVITSRDASQWNGSLNIEQFFSGNGQLYLARPNAEMTRVVSASNTPQQGAIAFTAQPVDAVAELPQLQTVTMLSNVLFSDAPAPAVEEPAVVQPQPTANPVQPSAPMMMAAALTVSEPPKITNAIDRVGAHQGSLTSGSVTDDKLAVLVGTASAGALLNVLDGGVVIDQVQADAQGNWRFEPQERLAESGHVFTVVDTASGETSAGFVLIVDSVAPSRAIIDNVINDQAGGTVVGNNQHTSDNTPAINGRGEAFSMIAIYNGKMLIGTSFANASGVWTFSSSFAFPDGTYTLTAKAIDFAGNVGLDSPIYTITIDTIPPAVPVILSADDDVGPVTGSLSSGDLTDDRRPTLHGKAEAGVTIFVYDGINLLGTTIANELGNWDFRPAANLADGEHQFSAMARDRAGNQSTVSDNFTLQFGADRTPAPVISDVTDDVGSIQGTLASGAQTDNAKPTLHGQARPGNTIRIYDNGTVIGEVTADAQGRWEFTPQAELSEGPHSLQAQALDGIHSPSLLTPAFEFNLDLTPPDASSLRITGVYDDVGSVTGNVASGGRTDDRSPTISGTGPAGEDVVVFVTTASGQREVGRVRVGSDGHWSVHVNGVLNYGMNTFTAIAVDEAGNATAPGPGYSVVVTSQNVDGVGGYDLGASQSPGLLINTTVQGDELNPQVTRLANGNLLMVWQQNVDKVADGYDVVMQLLDPTGTHKIGSQQFVNQRNLRNQDTPSVSALADGGFVVVWESYINPPDNSFDGVMARRYDASGAAQTDEFLVNQTTAGSQRLASILGLPDGGYIVSWYSDQSSGSTMQRIYDAQDRPVTDEFIVGRGNNSAGTSKMVLSESGTYEGWYLTVWTGSDKSGNGVLGQMRTIDGTTAGPVMTLNTIQDGNQNFPRAITLRDGSFVVFWESNDSQTAGSDIRATHFAFDPQTGVLNATSGDLIVNEYRKGDQYKPTGVALEDGGYMLIWGSNDGDGNGSAIFAQRFDAHDQKVGHEFLVNPTTWGNQGYPNSPGDISNVLDATLLANGKIFVTWESDKIDADGYGIEGVVIDANASFYSEFQVNTTIANAQQNSRTTELPGGGFMVTWESYETEATTSSIKAQLYDASGIAVGEEFRVSPSTLTSSQLRPTITALSDGSVLIAWQNTGGYPGGYDSLSGRRYDITHDASGHITGAVSHGDPLTLSSDVKNFNRNPMVIPDEDGGYTLAWIKLSGNQWSIMTRQFDSEGNATDVNSFEVARTNVTQNPAPSGWDFVKVDTLADGCLVFAYATTGTGYDVAFKIFDPITKTLSAEVTANQVTAGNQQAPGVAALGNGNFVVIWDSNDNSGLDQSGLSMWGRIFSPDGAPVGNEFLVNTFTSGDQRNGRVISHPGGGFVVLYESYADDAPGYKSMGIYAHFFSDDGHKIGQELRIHQLVAGDQTMPDVTFLEDGRMFVTWTDAGVGDGNGSAVKGRIIDLDTSLGLDVTPQTGAAPAGIDAHSLADGIAHSDLWMLLDDGSSHGMLLSSDALTTVHGGAGNDVIGIASTAFTAISGGDGIDTLLLSGKNMSLDLDALVNRITGIEKIDLGQGNANSLSLSAGALEGMGQQDMIVADGKNQFVVNGDSSNSLQLVDTQAQSWTETGDAKVGGVMYHTWVSGSTEVLVEQNIHVTVI